MEQRYRNVERPLPKRDIRHAILWLDLVSLLGRFVSPLYSPILLPIFIHSVKNETRLLPERDIRRATNWPNVPFILGKYGSLLHPPSVSSYPPSIWCTETECVARAAALVSCVSSILLTCISTSLYFQLVYFLIPLRPSLSIDPPSLYPFPCTPLILFSFFY